MALHGDAAGSRRLALVVVPAAALIVAAVACSSRSSRQAPAAESTVPTEPTASSMVETPGSARLVPTSTPDHINLFITPGNVEPAIPYVEGDRFLVVPGMPPRSFGPNEPLCGSATLSADGQTLYYHAADNGTPTIRSLDLATGNGQLIVPNACEMAISPGGRIAFARGGTRSNAVRAWDRQLTMAGAPELLVQDGASAQPTAWATGDEYIPLMWAGERLFARSRGLVMFGGPGRPYDLGNSELIAVEPSGDRALIVTSMNPVERDGTVTAKVVRMADGAVQGELDLRSAGVGGLTPGGEWAGNYVISAETDLRAMHLHPRLIVVDLSAGTPRIVTALGFQNDGVGPFHLLTQPEFIAGDPTRVRAWWSWNGRTYIECDLRALTCLPGPSVGKGSYFVN